MADITASLVNELRTRTSAPMMECKKALIQTDGDIEAAIDVLRTSGAAKAAKKADRETSEGRIAIAKNDNKIAIIKLHCETDFVARNDNFIEMANKVAETALDGADEVAGKLEEDIQTIVGKISENITIGQIEVRDIPSGAAVSSYIHTNDKIGVITILSKDESLAEEISMHAAAMNPSVIRPENISDEEMDREKAIYLEQMKEENKPDDIKDKIMTGKLKKYSEERSLMTQSFIVNSDITVGQALTEKGAELIDMIRLDISGGNSVC